ncbi:MAG: Chaperone protein DnaK [uncultured Thiotrichaceae bacterium]|uniref:Chaperone protein DnaK n=1 Tax=uncultured Thiotrichaceae bacterium TaxID=298394 RepID=A0A6S6S7H8_9GAMM|nr:MAG: Chaperone protein DnaK [uncultured Thiotrichaceae bacterium]
MKIIGIDLGTTNSACAIWQEGEVVLIPNELGEFLTPSVVHIEKSETVVVGRTARQRTVTHPDATASVFKRYMGTDRKIRLNKKDYTAVELSSFVLQALKKDAEAFLGEEVVEAVISVPAYFSDAQRKATVLAGELAGLRVERLINEPTAAAMSYGLHEKPEHTQFMVVDLGGGTFDVSIMEYFEGVLEVHSSSGDNFLGGEDFLEILVNKFLSMQNLSKKHLKSDDLQKVYLQMEKVKREFNSVDVVDVEPFIKKQKETVSMRRDDFVELAKPLLQRIQQPVETALRDAELMPADLDEVILVGGATRMQFFRSMIARMFRRMPSANLDPDLVVAMGAAIQAGLKAKDQALDDVVLTDVCPYSLGTNIVNENDTTGNQGDLFSAIIERNTVIPASRSARYVTASDNQKVVELKLYQGESRLTKNNIKLGQISIKVPKAKRGEEQIEVRFSYDMNGILEVDVEVVSTREKYYHMIQNAPGALTEKEIQASKDKLSQLKFHPREDAMNRDLIARAERLFESRIGDERENIRQALSWFEGEIESQTPSKIENATQEFSRFLEELEGDCLF